MKSDNTNLPNGQDTQQFLVGFDLESLRLPQDFCGTFEVKKQLSIVPVRKPPKDRFFRTHPDPQWHFSAMVLELKTEGELYLLGPNVRDIAPGLTRPMTLYAAIDQSGNPFLIPVPLPGPDGKRNSWHDSLADKVLRARSTWIRCEPNKAIGGYDYYTARGNIPEPQWPEGGFQEMLAIGLRGKVIETADHPIIRQILGLA